MSPALSLLPGMDHNLTEFSFLQQSETEFAPLRAYPDVSMASERFPTHNYTTHASEHASLSQHPLAQEGILSEEGESSCCSLSQHSLSPGEQSKPEEKVHPPVIVIDAGSREKDPGTLTNPAAKLTGDPVEDETFFLSKDIPAQHLLELLQKDVGMLSSSSSAVSSASEISVKRIESFKSHEVSKLITQQNTDIREGPQDEASFPQRQTQQHDRFSNLDQPHTEWEPNISNVTMGSRSTQPDESSEMLHRELLSEVERCTRIEAESKNKQQKGPMPPGQSFTPYLKEMPEAKPSVSRTNVVGMQWTGSAGVERVRKEQELWSSGNQTGIDGSYLGFLPQSQSTPGVFNAPTKFSVKAKLGHLSSIESNKKNSYQSMTEISLQPVPIVDAHNPDTATECQEDTTSAKVQSLPSLNYMQKVDAWRANQSSGKMSLFDSLALQGFSGIPPKQKAYDAVSDSLNRLVSQKVRSLQQPLVSGAATQTSSTAPSGPSSPRRTEAVGSAPTDEENTGSAVPPSASPIGRSQSHSSLSTVVMSAQKDEQIDRPPEIEKSQSQDDHDQTITGKTSHLTSLGHFSDVSLDRDLTLSSSQDSYSGIKLGPSTGTSSVVSLEIDNYVPSWTSKLLTPPPLPKPRELNIDERIPLYLRNLGIDQSPSTILTPFAPRGPIREPEFSPTEFCTIKGSTGTPTKSTQPSEGGSPHKEEFSRSSILSVDSSISIPFSLDSLGPAASIPEHTRWTSPPSDTEASQSKHKLAPYLSPDENTHSSTLQKDGSLSSNTSIGQLEDKRNSDVSSAIKERHRERNLESHLQTSRSTDQSGEDSFVSAKALLEIRKLVSHAETMISTGSSAASSTSPIAPHLLSDQDILLSLKKKTSRLQDLSSSSCTAGDPRTCSSLLWTRSSSDPMLTSEKTRQNSVGQEGVNRSLQLDYPSTQALFTAQTTVACRAPQDITVSGVGTSLVLSKSALRTEPEGCSAAPPDKAPTQPAVISPPTAERTEELTATPADSVDVPVEEEVPPSDGAAQSRSSSPILEDTDQGVMSNGSSESSLTARVAKLLQSDSPSTMVSSTPSITDQEESKARECIKLKLSGQQCEPLQLDEEDRRRIEEIKQELLLKNPIKSQFSTDTDSSAASSVKFPRELDPPQHVETFAAPNDATNQPTQLPQSLSRTTPELSIQQQTARQSDLEARVCEIAAREGVMLPTKKPQAFTSITIGTRRRSTSPSPSPSASPAPPVSPASEPLHLTELSTEAVKTTTADRQLSSKLNQEHSVALVQTTTKESLSLYGPNSSLQNRNQNVTSQSAPGSQKRQDTVGGQFEEPLLPSQGLDRDVTVRDNSTQLFRPDSKISASGVGVDHGSDQAAGSSTVEASVQTGHVSHVHLTLSPKATDRTITTVICSSHVDVISGLPRKEFVPLRHSSSAASSPDEGVGLSSPPEWCNTREPLRQWPPETVVPQGRLTTTSPQSFTPCDRSEISPRPLTTKTPVTVLLPYKPRGSEEVFYVPQTEADVSSVEMSDTTMESTHTGSDDAVPPRFSSDILGHRDPGLDRGVTIRHAEGIYSKRLKTVNFTMQENGQRDASIAIDESLQIVSQRPKPPSQVSFALTRELRNQETFKRDQGTSPIQFHQHDQPESRPEIFQPFDSEMDYSKGNTQWVQTSEPQTRSEQQRRSSDRPLDQLWQKFCDQWTREELCPTSDREASLLERLERLSRLIHRTRGSNVSQVQEGNSCNPEQKQERRREDVTQRRKERKTLDEVKRSVHGEVREQGWKVRGQRKTEPPIQLRFRVDESSRSAEDDSHTSLTSSFSHSSSQNQHPSPTDRDESETVSTTSGSMSTVDTARLLRVFGPDKVQRLKTTPSLSKLYNTINKQKEEREERRARSRNPPHIFTLSATTSTADQSVAADSTSSTSTYTAPSHHGPSRNLRAKKAVKLVNKSIQAGDLEIVHNGTRRHTRDVGTTFPSPGGARAFGQISFSSSSVARGGGGQRSPPKVQGVQKQRRSKRTPPKPYPKGVSWFISADGLGSEARKENQPEEERPSITWFEPYSRINPWRQPLRQRQVHEDTNKHHAEPDPKTMMMSSGLAHMSLQEALEMRRPEFISRSRQRVNRLTLQVEERKLQAAFTRERGELFNQLGGPARLPRPAGTALLRRAVPRKEMIQRSKQIYENLPEVQRRREEERRKAEYHTYRLNAQLFNKRITNRVLGRRSAWQ
ncbi:uncharacterized protein alms1 isoform X2 [Archocentrus centrarchus]|nr:uncharacterized protein LOC115772901 isoform X2 [Archocentrus centrarchus]